MGNERVHGPYDRGYGRKRWRVVIVGTDGSQRAVSFATEGEATAAMEEESAELGEVRRTVDSATAAYIESRRGDLRPRTLETNETRLRGMLRLREGDRSVAAVTPAVAAKLYRKRVAETAGDTHIGELALVVAMWNWLVDQGWCRANPWEDIVSVGRKRTRQVDLRVDDARKLLAVALAENSREGLAVGAVLLLGVRATELMSRTVRDIDDRGRLLWIPCSKTPKGRRAMEIPAVLRPGFQTLIAARGALEPLWGVTAKRRNVCDRQWLYHHVKRLCRVARIAPLGPHALRSLHASIAVVNRVTPEVVAAALGHTSAAVTRRHYIAHGLEADVAAEAVEEIVVATR